MSLLSSSPTTKASWEQKPLHPILPCHPSIETQDLHKVLQCYNPSIYHVPNIKLQCLLNEYICILSTISTWSPRLWHPLVSLAHDDGCLVSLALGSTLLQKLPMTRFYSAAGQPWLLSLGQRMEVLLWFSVGIEQCTVLAVPPSPAWTGQHTL